MNNEKKPGIILRRYAFLNRKQHENESISDYIGELRKLIMDCEYPAVMIKVMLRDVFISGLWSKLMQNKFLEKDDISLKQTLDMASFHEEIQHDALIASKFSQKETENDVSELPSDEKKTSSGTENISSDRNYFGITSIDSIIGCCQTEKFLINSSLIACRRRRIEDYYFVNLNENPEDEAVLKIFTSDSEDRTLLGELQLRDIIYIRRSVGSDEFHCKISLLTHDNITNFTSPPLQFVSVPLTGTMCVVSKLLPYLSSAWERIHRIPKIPRDQSIWGVNKMGDIIVSDKSALLESQCTGNGRYLKNYSTFVKSNKKFAQPLRNGFPIHSAVTIKGAARESEFEIKLFCSHPEEVALHFHASFEKCVIVLKDRTRMKWGQEKKFTKFNVGKGQHFNLRIQCMEKCFKLVLNESMPMYFNHRLSPELITHVEMDNSVNLDNIWYESDNVILQTSELIWRNVFIPTKVIKVETCSAGVTWALDDTYMPWAYKKKLDGVAYWSSVESTKIVDLSLNILNDTVEPKAISVWAVGEDGRVLCRSDVTTENVTGTKWEYIPACQSLHNISCGENNQVWCSANNMLFWRHGISADSPKGDSWRTVDFENHIIEKLTVGKWAVWVLDANGDLYIRREITPWNPGGVYWLKVYDEGGEGKFKHVHAGNGNVWAIKSSGLLCRRIGINAENPDGVSWEYGISECMYICE